MNFSPFGFATKRMSWVNASGNAPVKEAWATAPAVACAVVQIFNQSTCVGASVGEAVGVPVGATVGNEVVGAVVGTISVGYSVGATVGWDV